MTGPEDARFRFAFRSGGEPVVVSVAVPAAVAVVSALFPDARVDDPGGAAVLALGTDEGGWILTTPQGSWRSPDLDPLLVQVELALAEELALRTGLPGVHAGGVVLGGGAVLFPGEGGSGKSSLTASLALKGAPVLGDDVVFLDSVGMAHAFRRLIKVEGPARALLGLPAPSAPLGTVWPDAAFYRPQELGSRWADPAPVRSVVLLRRGGSARAELAPLRPAQVLPSIVAGLVLTDRVDPAVFLAVASALASASCWELRYPTTSEGAAVLLARLG